MFRSQASLKIGAVLSTMSVVGFVAPAFAQQQNSQGAVGNSLFAAAMLSTQERLDLVNTVDPELGLKCSNLEGRNCDRRVILAIQDILKAGRPKGTTPEQLEAFLMLRTWAETNREAIADAEARTEKREENKAAALEDDAKAEAKAKAEADAKAAAEKEALKAQRKEARKERRAAAAADADADAGEVETEKVTEQTSRSSNEDKAENNDTKNLLTALGIVGAAVVAGKLLDNGDEVVSQEGDRMVVRRDGELVVRKNENELLRRPGSDVRTQRFDDGSTRTTVVRPNGVKIVTIRDADGNTIRRIRTLKDGREVVLFDDTKAAEREIDESQLRASRNQTIEYEGTDAAALRRALRREEAELNRTFSLRQIRNNVRVRNQVPQIDLDAINFESGSAAIRPNEARDLAELGNAIAQLIEENPYEVFLIEGHTDAVGSDVYNLALSDRRAESVALALTEYFDVPPENLVVQGYGERFLKRNTQLAERANRRAVVRRITPLLTAGR